MKNYLVKHGESELHGIIESERSRLNGNEFLNTEAMLEAARHKIVPQQVFFLEKFVLLMLECQGK